MAKFTFDKSAKKTEKQRTPKPITKTEISKPAETYDPSKVEVELSQPEKPKKRGVGRPHTGRKTYNVIRVQKSTVLKINALKNTLGLANQDETVDMTIDRVLNSFSDDDKRAYKFWLEMYEKKEDK